MAHDTGEFIALAADAARVARLALAEDGERDITSELTVGVGQRGEAVLEARSGIVMAGTIYADAVLAACDLPPARWAVTDGSRLGAGAVAGTISGGLRQILRAERPMLNLLQRACGIATVTRTMADALVGTHCRVLHTRKTTPGLRLFEVVAVMAGGGQLHRIDLTDTVMVKDNHWQALKAAGLSLRDALAAAGTERYVEVETLDQLDEACAAGATRLLIDNQTPETVREWASRARTLRPGIEVEATGGITPANARAYADAGADFVSAGFLTHSVAAADLGLEISTLE